MTTVYVVKTKIYNNEDTIDIHVFETCYEAEDFAKKMENFALQNPNFELEVNRCGEQDTVTGQEAYEDMVNYLENEI